MINMDSDNNFSQYKTRCENFLMKRFPSMSKSIDAIHIGSGAKYTVGLAGRQNGLMASFDSYTNEPKSYWKTPKASPVRFNFDPLIQAKMQGVMEGGAMDSAVDKKTLMKNAMASMSDAYMAFDSATQQYVINVIPKGKLGKGSAFDSIITQTAIPYWNIGFSDKIFKQPYLPTRAFRLVDVDSFNNPWCDVVLLNKETFEGYGKFSNVAHGTVEATENDPVTNDFTPIASNIINISIDYAVGTFEKIEGNVAGNFLTSRGISDRASYADLMMEYIHNSLLYFGGGSFLGLANVATNETYSGTPLNETYEGTSTTKGSDIAQAVIKLIADFLQDNHYLSNEVRVNTSSYVYKALTSTVYSDVYNPKSPKQVIEEHFAKGEDLGEGLKTVTVSFEVDPMLDPNTTFNDNDYDMTFITVPSLNSALGRQDGLVIAPKPLDKFIVPPMLQRSGMLYTSYKRVGSVIAPIEGTVKIIKGLGYQG